MNYTKDYKPNLKDEVSFDKFMDDILDEEVAKKKLLEDGEDAEHSDLRKVLDEKTDRPANKIIWR